MSEQSCENEFIEHNLIQNVRPQSENLDDTKEFGQKFRFRKQMNDLSIQNPTVRAFSNKSSNGFIQKITLKQTYSVKQEQRDEQQNTIFSYRDNSSIKPSVFQVRKLQAGEFLRFGELTYYTMSGKSTQNAIVLKICMSQSQIIYQNRKRLVQSIRMGLQQCRTIQNIPLFENMTIDQIELSFENVSYAQDEPIYSQNDFPYYLYVLQSGQVEVQLQHEQSSVLNPKHTFNKFIINPGSLLGREEVISKSLLKYSAKSVSRHTTLSRISILVTYYYYFNVHILNPIAFKYYLDAICREDALCLQRLRKNRPSSEYKLLLDEHSNWKSGIFSQIQLNDTSRSGVSSANSILFKSSQNSPNSSRNIRNSKSRIYPKIIGVYPFQPPRKQSQDQLNFFVRSEFKESVSQSKRLDETDNLPILNKSSIPAPIVQFQRGVQENDIFFGKRRFYPQNQRKLPCHNTILRLKGPDYYQPNQINEYSSLERGKLLINNVNEPNEDTNKLNFNEAIMKKSSNETLSLSLKSLNNSSTVKSSKGINQEQQLNKDNHSSDRLKQVNSIQSVKMKILKEASQNIHQKIQGEVLNENKFEQEQFTQSETNDKYIKMKELNRSMDDIHSDIEGKNTNMTTTQLDKLLQSTFMPNTNMIKQDKRNNYLNIRKQIEIKYHSFKENEDPEKEDSCLRSHNVPSLTNLLLKQEMRDNYQQRKKEDNIQEESFEIESQINEISSTNPLQIDNQEQLIKKYSGNQININLENSFLMNRENSSKGNFDNPVKKNSDSIMKGFLKNPKKIYNDRPQSRQLIPLQKIRQQSLSPKQPVKVESRAVIVEEFLNHKQIQEEKEIDKTEQKQLSRYTHNIFRERQYFVPSQPKS